MESLRTAANSPEYNGAIQGSSLKISSDLIKLHIVPNVKSCCLTAISIGDAVSARQIFCTTINHVIECLNTKVIITGNP